MDLFQTKILKKIDFKTADFIAKRNALVIRGTPNAVKIERMNEQHSRHDETMAEHSNNTLSRGSYQKVKSSKYTHTRTL